MHFPHLAAPLAFLLLFTSCLEEDTPPVVTQQTEGLLTRAEYSDYEETSTFADVVALVDSFAAQPYSPLRVGALGETSKGRVLPLAVFGAADTTWEAVYNRTRGKLRMLLIGNIHAGEVAGKEALLELLRELGEGEHAEWADSLVVLAVPIYNADGNERVAVGNRPGQYGPVKGMGERPNAQGLDLNRDFVKRAAPETRALVRAMNRFDPHLVVDLHTTNGTIHGYHLTYAPPLGTATPEPISEELRERLLPTVTDAVREQTGFETWHYGNLPGAFGGDDPRPRGWYTYSGMPRYGVNYAGLRGRLGLLSEAYSYASFEERIRASKAFVEAVADYAYTHNSRLRALTEAADAAPIVGQPLALAEEIACGPAHDVVLGTGEEQTNPYDASVSMGVRSDSVYVEPMPDCTQFRAVRTRRAPLGYLVPTGELAETLRAHGLDSEEMLPAEVLGDPDLASRLRHFRVDSVSVAEEPFQGVRLRTYTGAYTEGNFEGDFVYFSVQQPGGRLLFALLEPDFHDGLATWGQMEAEAGERFAVVRVEP